MDTVSVWVNLLNAASANDQQRRVQSVPGASLRQRPFLAQRSQV